MAKMTLGPVVGKVTATSARILVETDGDADVTCILRDTAGHETSESVSLSKNRPSVFSFQSLPPDTVHTVRFTGVSEPRTGRVTTFAASPTALTFAAVSCNNTPKRGDTDLWRELYFRYVAPGKVDLTLHLGDQVYGDKAFEAALDTLGGRLVDGKVVAARSTGTKKEEQKILELYRQLYRWAWNHPATQWSLAHTANLMIWDDHEIRDDWGSLPSDRDRTTAAFYVGGLARRVFREYQRQLWDDIDVDADPPPAQLEDHLHVWGETGVLFLDQRGARSFSPDPERPYLGVGQWSRITESLTNGTLSRCRALIVATSVPLLYLGTNTSSTGAAVVDDLKDHWSYGPHRVEQIEMLRTLRRWKEAEPDRELLVLGGDVHIGGHTDVLHENRVVFRQMITSAITNTPPAFLAYAAMRLLMEGEESLGQNYRFEHSNFTRKRNCGIVVVRIPAAGLVPKVEGSLLEATPESGLHD